MFTSFKRLNHGFTLVESLLVGAAVLLFIGLFVIAVNPARRFAENRDATRLTDVTNILNAVYKYSLNDNGALPPIPATLTDICAEGAKSCNGLVDLHMLVDGKFIASIPKDPKGSCGENSSCYKIEQTSNGRIMVTAPKAELNTISTTR